MESMILANDFFLRKMVNDLACRGEWDNIDLLDQLAPNAALQTFIYRLSVTLHIA